MSGKDKKQKITSGPVRIDRILYRIVGKEWERLPPSDHWVQFMAVMRPLKDNDDVFDVRIYDQWYANQKGVRVVDYATFDFHPDLVLFEGWYDRKAGKGSVQSKKVELEKVA